MKPSFVFGLLAAAVVAVSAQSNEELMQQGTMLIRNGAYDQAVTCFRKVVSRDQRNFEAQFNLALSYLNLGRNANAVEEFKKALSINGASTDAWSNLAVAYQNLGKSEEAVSALDKAVKLNPDNLQARLNIASMYASQQKYEQAIAQYKQVLQMDVSQTDAYLNIAKCYISTGKYTEAETMLRKGLADNAEDAGLYSALGNIFWERDKNADSAASYYRQAIGLEPEILPFRENLATVLEQGADKAAAARAWKECLPYTSDAMKKEAIQRKIDALEGRDASGAAAVKGNPFAGQEMQMQKVTREEEKPKSEAGAPALKGQKMDVSGDLDDLKSTEGEDRFKIDLKKKK